MKDLCPLTNEKIDQMLIDFLPNLKGKIIVFEGINGAGKSTYANMLGKIAADAGYEVLITQEPGHIPVDWSLVGELNPTTQCLLYLADRAEHIESAIKPALTANQIVICDRFFDSSYVYHPECQELVKQFNLSVLSSIGSFIYRIFLLDLSPNIALDIVGKRQKKSMGVVPKTLQDFQNLAERYKKTMDISPIRKRHRVALPSFCTMREIKESLLFGDGGINQTDEI